MPVKRGPPGLLATWTVAHDLDMAIARAPGGSTVARLPSDRDAARLPCIVQAALGGPGHFDHHASRTQFRSAGSLMAQHVLAHGPLPCQGRLPGSRPAPS
jgi:hypothetical protein